MNIFIVNYDLKSPGQDYTPLYSAIKACGDWYHIMDSAWLVATDNLFANDIVTNIKQYIDNNDWLYVVLIDPSEEQGWLPKQVWDWIEKYRNL